MTKLRAVPSSVRYPEVEVLRGVHDVLRNPDHWMKFMFYGIRQRETGYWVTATPDKADSFCLQSAIEYMIDGVYHNPEGKHRMTTLVNRHVAEGICTLEKPSKAQRLVGWLLRWDFIGKSSIGLAAFNDDPDTKHEDVIEVVELAIDLAIKERKKECVTQ